MTDQELITRLTKLYNEIFIWETYGASDLINLEIIWRELNNKGYIVTTNGGLKVEKYEKD